MATVPVNDNSPINQYTATASQTVFSFTFWVEEAADLDVYVNGVLKTLTTDYTVSGVQQDAGGAVTFVSGLALNDAVTITRSTQVDRVTGYNESGGGGFRGSTLNLEFARLVAMIQEIQRDLDRVIRLSAFSTTDTDALICPDPTGAKRALVFNASGVLSLSTYDPDLNGASLSQSQYFAASSAAPTLPVASGFYSFAIGHGAQALKSYDIVLGTSAVSQNTGSNGQRVVIGVSAQGRGDQSVAISSNSEAHGTGDIALGWLSTTVTNSTTNKIALGVLASSSGQFSIAAGANSVSSNTTSIAIGGGSNNTVSARATGAGSIAIGTNVQAQNTSDIALGDGAVTGASGSRKLALGYGASATAQNGVCIGSNNCAGSYSLAIGANVNVTGGNAIGVGGGSSASSLQATATLGAAFRNNAVANKYGQIAWGHDIIAAIGDRLFSQYVFHQRTTTTAASQEVFLDGTSSRLTLVDNQTIQFTAQIFGKEAAGVNVGAWVIEGCINRGSGAGSTAIVGTNITRTISTPTNWAVPTLVADTTNGALKLQVNPNSVSAKTIEWMALVQCVEVIW